jgi:carboxymethylenebutenolidase
MATESTVTLTAGDGHTFSAFRAEPADTPKGTVVVLPDGAGRDEKIRKIVDGFTADGYIVIAPTLSEPTAPAETAAGENGAEQPAPDPIAPLLAELQSTIDSVKDSGKVAVVGYGAGGGLAYTAANRVAGLACAVSYYGTGIIENSGAKRKIPTLLHFGEADALVPFPIVNQFRAYHPEVSAFSYPGAAHDFDVDGKDSYDETATKAALDRTTTWISQYVVGQPPIALKNAGAYAMAKVDKKKKKKSDDDMGPPMD